MTKPKAKTKSKSRIKLNAKDVNFTLRFVALILSGLLLTNTNWVKMKTMPIEHIIAFAVVAPFVIDSLKWVSRPIK